MAILKGTNKADTLNGTAQNDSLFGDNGNDVINGGAGDDYIDGGNGSDMISGGAGNDWIDGGNGQDTLVLAGKRSDYRIMEGVNGAVIVRDLRAGRPDGEDQLFSVERIQFSDGIFKLVDLIQANVPPVANNDSLTLAETAGKTEITSILLANDSDADGDLLVVSSVQAVSAQGAVVSIGPDGKVSYDAGSIFADLDNGETATDSFTYTITDGNGHISTATATVTITGVTQNVAPVAGNDAITVVEDSEPTDVTTTLLANDTDADGGVLTIAAVQGLSDKGAVVTLSVDGKVSYDPGLVFLSLEQGQTATDSFTYTVTDAGGLTSTATATVTITGVTQEEHSIFIVEEDGISQDMFGILVETLGFEIVGIGTQGTLGTVELGDGTLTFTADHPDSDSMLPDNWDSTFFTVLGANGESALVEMIIQGLNDPITAVDDSITVAGGEVSGNLWGILMSNDQDLDGLAVAQRIASVDTTGTLGAVSFNAATKSLTYSAAALDLADGETVTDSFSYTVADGYGSTDIATVTVTVTSGPGGGFTTSIAGGESIMSAFVGGGGMSHLDDAEFASFPAMQEILVADSVVV